MKKDKAEFRWEVKQIFIKNGANIPFLEPGWEPFAAQSNVFDSSSLVTGHLLWLRRKVLNK